MSSKRKAQMCGKMKTVQNEIRISCSGNTAFITWEFSLKVLVARLRHISVINEK